MSEIKLGQLIEGLGERDAVHVALAPVIAAQRLAPGQHVGLIQAHNTELVGVCSEPIGIVDPFLDHSVERGQRFYVMLYPNTVTGMRHQWEHPAFPPPGTQESEDWMRDLADELGKDYIDLLGEIGGGSVYTGSEERYGVRENEDIRRHYRIITGVDAPSEIHFRCAC